MLKSANEKVLEACYRVLDRLPPDDRAVTDMEYAIKMISNNNLNNEVELIDEEEGSLEESQEADLENRNEHSHNSKSVGGIEAGANNGSFKSNQVKPEEKLSRMDSKDLSASAIKRVEVLEEKRTRKETLKAWYTTFN